MAENMKKVGVIGSGNIGRSYAMLFARGGYKVSLYDIDKEQLERAASHVKERFKELYEGGMWHGALTDEQATAAVTTTTDMATAVKDAFIVMECVPEFMDLKLKVYAEVDPLLGPDTILASSTSSMNPNKLSENLKHKENFIVAHPLNPPLLVKFIEVIPAEWARGDLIELMVKVLKDIGHSPVLCRKLVEGFPSVRIQHALLCECWNLIKDGVVDAEGIDTIMRDGLGLRYAFMGPMETILLNGDGVVQYCERFGKMIKGVCETFGPVPSWSPDDPIAKAIEDELAKRIPLDKLEERKQWRDKRLAALAKLKKDLDDADAKAKAT